VTVALIGAGRWGKNWLRVLSELDATRLCWLCDTALDTLPTGGIRTTRELDRVLADPSVEAVVIATPSPTHAALACRALDAGKHVLVEKPLALSLDEAERVSDAARRSRRRVMVGHILLHHPAIHRLASELASAGRPRSFFSERSVLAVAGRTEDAWWTLGSHDVSLIRHLAGSDPIGVAVENRGPGTPAEVVRARLWFEDGAEAVLELSCVARRKVRRLQVITDRQALVLDDHGREALLATHAGTLRIDVSPEPLLIQARAFAARIRDGAPAVTDIDEAMAVMRVLDAGARSMARGGAAVDLAPAPRTKAV
jgi:predicted dehydrogenase